MRVLDPLLFLTGHRGAIERIAATRHAWVIGAILVLSAGIARNYDHLDLLRNLEWVIGPFAASLFSIFFIFGCIAFPLRLKDAGKLWPQLLAFLTFAWMTAPCAWLYGIPVESMTDLVTATKWNIAFLAIVSLWRVVLMTRAVAVLAGVENFRAFVLILAPAAFEAMVGSAFKGMSLVGIMGGVRLPPHTKVLLDATQFVMGASFWIFVATFALCCIVPGRALLPLSRPSTSSPRGPAILAAVAFAAWVLIAAPFYPLAANQQQLETLIWRRNFDGAVEFASARQRTDFLRDHEFPGNKNALVMLEHTTSETPAWLKQEWTSAAFEDFTYWLTIHRYRDKEKLAELRRLHPDIWLKIQQHADELRSRRDILNNNEEVWLRYYEEITEAVPEKQK